MAGVRRKEIAARASALPPLLLFLVLLLMQALPTTAAAAATATSPSTTTGTARQVSHTSSSSSSSSSATASPTVFNTSQATGVAKQYVYQGCFLEAASLNYSRNATGDGDVDSDGRSLQNGTDEVLPDDMTVLKCLKFCGGGSSGTAYLYAGLEGARECWCGLSLSPLAARENSSACDLPCDGDRGTICGGRWRLTLYMLSAAPALKQGALWALVAAMGTIAMNLL